MVAERLLREVAESVERESHAGGVANDATTCTGCGYVLERGWPSTVEQQGGHGHAEDCIWERVDEFLEESG